MLVNGNCQGALGKISSTADVWSDPNLVPYMAVTSHWIDVKTILTAEGPHRILKLRSELVAFHHLEGRHTGVHLADAFVNVLHRLNIISKVELTLQLHLHAVTYSYFNR